MLDEWLKTREKPQGGRGREEEEADLNFLKLDGCFNDVDIQQMIEDMDPTCDIPVELDDERVDQRVMVLKQCLATLCAIHNNKRSLCGCFSGTNNCLL